MKHVREGSLSISGFSMSIERNGEVTQAGGSTARVTCSCGYVASGCTKEEAEAAFERHVPKRGGK